MIHVDTSTNFCIAIDRLMLISNYAIDTFTLNFHE